ncbi:polyamine aminopropyltransferase, partial [Klebsiella pneumoniae]
RDVSFFLAAFPSFFGGFLSFAWACVFVALRLLSCDIFLARFLYANLTCRFFYPTFLSATFAFPLFLHIALSAPCHDFWG